MRKVLALDYGEKRVGVAVGWRGVVETRPVLCLSGKKLTAALLKLCQEEEIGLILVGVSEGKMAEKSKRFAKRLENIIKLPVQMIDETLTTQQAKRIKKKGPVDSVAAALMLEDFFFRKEGR